MPVPMTTIQITAANITRWSEGFALLSMDRFVPFWREIGLPAAVSDNPAPMLRLSRQVLENVLVERSSPQSLGNVIEARAQAANFFAKVSTEYGRNVARSLMAWFECYFADERLIDTASVWRSVFRHICEITRGDEPPVEGTLSAGTVARICRFVEDYLDPGALRALEEGLKSAHSLPRSSWEESIESKVRYSAGQGANLGAIDIAADAACLIATTRRTAQLWHGLKSLLSDAEFVQLSEWANRQAVAMRLPPAKPIECHPD